MRALKLSPGAAATFEEELAVFVAGSARRKARRSNPGHAKAAGQETMIS